jgi:hypothetical protein
VTEFVQLTHAPDTVFLRFKGNNDPAVCVHTGNNPGWGVGELRYFVGDDLTGGTLRVIHPSINPELCASVERNMTKINQCLVAYLTPKAVTPAALSAVVQDAFPPHTIYPAKEKPKEIPDIDFPLDIGSLPAAALVAIKPALRRFNWE